MPLNLLPRKPVKGSPLRKGDRVIATVDLPGVPEGTAGKVKLVNGLFRDLSWRRYWVFFNNGVDKGSIHSQHLVRASEWDEFQEKRNAAPVASSEAKAAAPATAATSEDGPAAGGSRVPEHLLERSRNRRQALGL